MIIRIDNLRLRTIIGCNDWERDKRQEVVINMAIETKSEIAQKTDDIEDAIDYRDMTKRVAAFVEASAFNLLERLAAGVLGVVMEDARVSSATVRVDKPHALRFADSVSVELFSKR